MPKESYRSDLRIERYKNRKMGLGFGFQRVEKKEEKKKKESAGERRRAATGAGHASTIRWSNTAPARRRHVSPTSRAEPRREPSRPDRPTRGYAEAGARGRRACSLRLAPSRAHGHALPACCWARERAWNGQFGPVVFCFPDFCPGSSSNTVFT